MCEDEYEDNDVMFETITDILLDAEEEGTLECGLVVFKVEGEGTYRYAYMGNDEELEALVVAADEIVNVEDDDEFE